MVRSSPVERGGGRPARRWIGIGAAAVVVVGAVGALFWQSLRPPQSTPEAALTRLTHDPGLTTEPALSPDGKLLAYASDRAGAGALDIWLQQVGGGEPVRLTRDAGQNRQPSFSPDGTRIVFRSTRDGGGIFLMPAFGGPARRIAPDGFNPVFSPDGTSVAYYIGNANLAALANARTELWVASTTGAAPREVSTGFSGVCCPIWTPDSGHLLFLGNRDANLPLEESLDWWVVPVGGGPVVKTGALTITRARGLRGQVEVAPFAVTPGVWDPTGRAVIFSARSGDSTNLWQVELSPGTFQAAGEPVRLTSGSAFEWQPSIAALAGGGRRVVFASLSENSDIWSFPVAADQARLAGGPRRLTDNAAQDSGTSLSGDGRKLVFLSNRTGFWQVWLKDLETGEETALTSSAREKFLPVLSPDGSQLTYAESGTWAIYLLRLDGGVEQVVPEAVGLATSFTMDGGILYHDVPGRVSLLDLASRRQTRLLEKPDHRLVDARLSPDGRWLTFWDESRGRARVLVAPYRGAAQIQEDEWIEVAASGFRDNFAHWSPGSNVIYSSLTGTAPPASGPSASTRSRSARPVRPKHSSMSTARRAR
jgi:Tol biopolymer transport system component